MLGTAATAFSALALLGTPPATVVAAGDVASCSSRGDEATAAIVERIPGTVAVLGDAVYDSGTTEEFRDCYSWRRFRARTRAALGNHEYHTSGAAPARAYFGLPSRGYYSYELGTWHVVVLNTNCDPAGGCGPGSPQQRWLEADLAASDSPCTLAYAHHPRFSSGRHGSAPELSTLWRTLARGGADVVLAGHDHHYERFAPHHGIRSFVVGTGGRSIRPVVRRLRIPRSVVVVERYGVLRLTLRAHGYDWRFVGLPGSADGDRGSGRCRGR